MARMDITKLTAGADALLEVTQDPLHRRILENYRRHALLEVSGQWEGIFEPDMTVEHPVYRLNENPSVVLDGADEVKAFYKRLVETRCNVMMLEDEHLAVGDWGFASESILNHFVPGSILAAQGEALDDLDTTYLVRHRVATFWPFDERGRMRGEHVYEDTASRQLVKLHPSDVISPADAKELLTPLIRPFSAFELAAT